MKKVMVRKHRPTKLEKYIASQKELNQIKEEQQREREKQYDKGFQNHLNFLTILLVFFIGLCFLVGIINNEQQKYIGQLENAVHTYEGMYIDCVSTTTQLRNGILDNYIKTLSVNVEVIKLE
jgi:preprotein translocase subunit SecG